MTSICRESVRVSPKSRSLRERIGGAAGAVVSWLLLQQQLYRERQQLLSMDDHMLCDLGVGRGDLEREFQGLKRRA